MADPYTILHGGFHKTASTFLQKTLQRNSGRLAKQGVYYVPHRDLRKNITVPAQQNAYYALGIRRKTIIEDTELQKISDLFFQPIKRLAPTRLILSDENLAGHCGNCVKTGQLYRFRNGFVASFAKTLPYPIRDIYFGVRGYADFFAAAYVEYIRSLQVDSTQIVAVKTMRERLFNHMPGWNGVINIIAKQFPHAHIYIWRFEDFVDHPHMANGLLQRFIGDQVDVSKFDAPKGKITRQSASARAMAEIERIGLIDGLPELVKRRIDIQAAYPRNAENPRFDPWLPWERAHLNRLYDADIARLRTNRHVTILDPQMLA